MTRLLCQTWLALGCAALLAGFADSLASWGTDEGGLGLAEAARTIAAQRERQQRLEVLARVTFRCLEAKDRVTRELAAGRLSVEEAAELFGRLEDERDEQLGRPPAARGPEREARLRALVEHHLANHRQNTDARRLRALGLPVDSYPAVPSPRFAP